jgi:hypothetical protein
VSIRVGELSSQVAVQAEAGGHAGTAPQGTQPQGTQPSWAERERQRRLETDERRDRARTAQEGFDG